MYRFCMQRDDLSLVLLQSEQVLEDARKWWEQYPALYTVNRYCVEEVEASGVVPRRWWLQCKLQHGGYCMVWVEEPNPAPRQIVLD
ncbi:MAG: hypothetical protein UY71_C0001G0010 [Parcubacteria group bacterium GW2011_GWB1_52_7]|nr:MAG: hypothetical protein UY64_C0024G0007 [Parcubacteria group bacterium GW2011_GWA1_51_12]KKW29200.1 MAG: hypothetical protein UY71_C0001G0010 [Parcubacteria group bacterium GW2011_GWB1_52_7]KKW31027.1 MAG: hypothetical protein UY75_C0017G0005 [Parcubacteria group bacterium GW2011_GWC2_52_8c]